VALTAALLAATAFAAPALQLGPATHGSFSVYKGYYDGHKDGYVITDVSSKSQGICVARSTSRRAQGRQRSATAVLRQRSRGPPAQIAVFGSEPGRVQFTTRSGMSSS